MNKNLKWALFLLGATVFNIVLMFVIDHVHLPRSRAASRGGHVRPRRVPYHPVSGFIASIVLTFLIYGKVTKWLQAKYNLEQHFPQLFKKKK